MWNNLPKKKKIFTKFLIFKKFTHFFTKQKNFFIKTYLDNDYLEIHKLWLNFFILQKSITKIKPKTIVSFEGDAWDHDMLYLLSKKIGFFIQSIQKLWGGFVTWNKQTIGLGKTFIKSALIRKYNVGDASLLKKIIQKQNRYYYKIKL